MPSEKQLVSVNLAHGHNHPFITFLYRCTFSLLVYLIAVSVIIATTGSFANSVRSFDDRAYSYSDQHARIISVLLNIENLQSVNDVLPTPNTEISVKE